MNNYHKYLEKTEQTADSIEEKIVGLLRLQEEYREVGERRLADRLTAKIQELETAQKLLIA